MSYITILLIAIGLSMDSVAVSISGGICMQPFCLRKSLKIASIMGGFQGGMTILGWALGTHFSTYITNFDHWIAFILLAYLGGKMIYDSFQAEEDQHLNTFSNRILLSLGVATSIDALAVGVSMAFLQINIWSPAVIIAFTTFFLSLSGVLCGFRFGKIKGLKVELLGGVILVTIGIKILVEHTLMA
jgi:putative Mn2+ efflux pump MntP